MKGFGLARVHCNELGHLSVPANLSMQTCSEPNMVATHGNIERYSLERFHDHHTTLIPLFSQNPEFWKMVVNVVHALLLMGSWQAIQGLGVWVERLVGEVPSFMVAAEEQAKSRCVDTYIQ